MTSIAVRIDGQDYADYIDASVTCSLENFTRTFQISYSDKWIQAFRNQFPFAEGAACEIVVDGEVVIDGFVDEINIDYNGTSHSMQVSGRSWNGHLVDASAVHKSGAWKNVDLQTIANDIASPFGVEVIIHPEAEAEVALAFTEKFRRWAIEDEETAYACIERAAKMRGLFLYSDAGRNVIVSRAGVTRTSSALVYGQNVIRANASRRYSERHSYYLVKSQMAGDETWYAEDASSKLFAKETDEEITAYRPLILVSDGQGTKPELELRAKWERNVRAGRSRRYTYEVNGWQRTEGGLWQPNERITVEDPIFDISGEMLIASVSFKQASPGGSTTTLELAAPESFDILVPPKKKLKKRKGVVW